MVDPIEARLAALEYSFLRLLHRLADGHTITQPFVEHTKREVLARIEAAGDANSEIGNELREAFDKLSAKAAKNDPE
ncbi:hypothetical protein SOM26_04120 [Sphingomonas sp. CFBP8993]|uniref:hypothetical protein n=1 Tax=Sphingomonas sp. CFBP8993 TaxID=3096526 RepID=UPI002A6A09EF|nr:hypothetical protein [Sphingomonas sp. CFBP8993]MDY0957866.1 hypothetical protein [Sphingomonas sp. CFBP8993]